MAKFHVNPNTGNAGSCKSTKGKCPFGSEEEHFSSPEAASAAAEKMMSEQYSAVNSAYRKKDTTALEGMNRELKKRIISEAVNGTNGLHPSVVAKVFSKDSDELIRKNVSEKFKSQKILREMSTDESARVRLAVAQATHNSAILKSLANDPDPSVRKAAISNKNTPVKVRKAAVDALKATANPPRTIKGPSDAELAKMKARKEAAKETPAERPRTREEIHASIQGQTDAWREYDAEQADKKFESENMSTRQALRKNYQGALTPSSERRMDALDDQMKASDPVVRQLATEARERIVNAKGKWAIDAELERFEEDANNSKIFPGLAYKGISRTPLK